jgi:hypothetical protein
MDDLHYSFFIVVKIEGRTEMEGIEGCMNLYYICIE